MKIAYYYMTSAGFKTASEVCRLTGGDVRPKDNFRENVRSDFRKYDALVFVMAAGIAVRMTAPLLEGKDRDPAVLVMDQEGKFVISLISGHLGGANDLARRISKLTGAQAVITTATDVEGVLSFDEFAKDNDLYIENLHDLRYISGALVEGKEVCLVSGYDITGNTEEYGNIRLCSRPEGEYSVIVTDRTDTKYQGTALILRPRDIVVGTGCKKNTDPLFYEECFLKYLSENSISIHSVYAVSTVGLKKNETAVTDLCSKYGFELIVVSDEEILSCGDIFECSEFVKSVTGLPAVAESSSCIASGFGEKITGKTRYPGITFASYRKKLPGLVLKRRNL